MIKQTIDNTWSHLIQYSPSLVPHRNLGPEFHMSLRNRQGPQEPGLDLRLSEVSCRLHSGTPELFRKITPRAGLKLESDSSVEAARWNQSASTGQGGERRVEDGPGGRGGLWETSAQALGLLVGGVIPSHLFAHVLRLVLKWILPWDPSQVREDQSQCCSFWPSFFPTSALPGSPSWLVLLPCSAR